MLREVLGAGDDENRDDVANPAAKAKRAALSKGIEKLTAELKRLRKQMTKRISWQFDSADDDREHGALVHLLKGLAMLRDPADPGEGHHR